MVTMVLAEQLTIIAASLVVGIILGWLEALIGLALIMEIHEAPMDHTFDWPMISFLTVLSITIVFVSVNKAAKVINKK